MIIKRMDSKQEEIRELEMLLKDKLIHYQYHLPLPYKGGG